MAYANGEAVVFDTSPIMRILLQEQQQHQMQNKALEEQIKTDMSRIKPDGIRSADTPDYTQAYKNMQDAGIKYRLIAANTKDPLQRAKAYNEFQDSISNVTGLINESKNAKEREKLGYGFYVKNADKLDLNSYNSYMTGVKSPVRSQPYKDIADRDISSVLFNPANFDANKWGTLLNSIKGVERVKGEEELKSGQMRQHKVKYTDPNALAEVALTGFNGNHAQSKNFFTTQFENASPEELTGLTDYARRYYKPDFEIKTPADYAVANAIYGKVEQDMGTSTKGSPWKAQQANQWALQRDRQDHEQKMYTQRKNDKGSSDINFAVDDMADGLRLGESSRVIAPLEGAAKSGTRVVWIQKGVMSDKLIGDLYAQIRAKGVDNITKNITKDQLMNGAAVVAVPKIDPKTKKIIEGEFDYMTITPNQANPQERLNRMINFAGGAKGKPLSQKWYNKHLGTSAIIDLEEGALDDVDEEEEEESVPDDENKE